MTSAAPDPDVIIKAGNLKKRSNRLHQFNPRYFILQGSKLSYKIKVNDATTRDTFDLIPGCIVTQVTESKTTISGKKIYSFWVVWPQYTKNEHEEADSDEEKEKLESTPLTTTLSATEEESKNSKVRKLQQIAESEAQILKNQKFQTEKQIEQMESRDNSMSLGAKVAAVAVGGVVVGGLSAGIGLVPYATVVGITAIAGGSAVAWQMGRKPLDSRLILACDTMDEALEWKTAIEAQISLLAETAKPSMPLSVDRKIISSILDRNIEGGVWKRVAVNEGLRILEHILPITKLQTSQPKLDWDLITSYCSNRCYDFVLNHAIVSEFSGAAAFSNVPSRCRRAQTVIKATPMNCLLMLMDSKNWPKNGSMKVVKEIDDHADIIEVEAITDCRSTGGKKKTVYRKLCFNRFWRLDDDGVYLITYNSTVPEDNPPGVKFDANSSYKLPSKDSVHPSVDAVIAIAPRVDFANFEYDVPESLVTCNCQVSTDGNWEKGESVSFMDQFLMDHLLELQYTLLSNKFDIYEPYTFTASVDPMLASGSGSNILPHAVPANTSEKIDRPVSTKQASLSSLDFQNSRVAHLGRRGVTTVQPGAEEPLTISTDFNNDDASVVSHVEDSTITKPKRTMLGYFTGKNRKLKESVIPVAVTVAAVDSHEIARPSRPSLYRSHSDGGKGNSSPPKSSPVQQSSPQQEFRKSFSDTPMNKKTDKAKNSEASMLRQQIETTEYELQRFVKSFRRKNIINPNVPGKPDKNQITAVEYNALQEQQAQLQQKLQNLRHQHVELTGVTYEQAKAARSTFNRLRALGGRRLVPPSASAGGFEGGTSNPETRLDAMSAVNSDHVPSSTQSSPSKEQIKHFFINACRVARPPHWLTYRKKPKKGLRSKISVLTNGAFWSSIFQAFLADSEDEDGFRVNALVSNQVGSFSAIFLFISFFVATQFLKQFIYGNFVEWISSLIIS